MPGPWLLNESLRKRNLEDLVKRLNELLEGRAIALSRVEKSPFSPRPDMSSEYTTLAKPVHTTEGRYPELIIPVGPWIKIPSRPLVHQSATYTPEVDINGDFVKIYFAALQGEPAGVATITYTLNVRGRR